MGKAISLLLVVLLAGCARKSSAMATELSEAVCECADAACASTKLKLLEAHVKDLAAMEPSEKDARLAAEALTDARHCAAKHDVGPFAEGDTPKTKKTTTVEAEVPSLERRVFAEGKFAILSPGKIDLTEKSRAKVTAYTKVFSLDGVTLQLQLQVRATPAPGAKTDPKLHDLLIGTELKAADGTELDRESRKLEKSKLRATFVTYDAPKEGKTRLAVIVVDDRTLLLLRATQKGGAVAKAWFERIADSFEVLKED